MSVLFTSLEIMLFFPTPYHVFQDKIRVCFGKWGPHYVQETVQIPYQCSEVLQNLPHAYDLREASTMISIPVSKGQLSALREASIHPHPANSSACVCLLSALTQVCSHLIIPPTFHIPASPNSPLYLTLRPYHLTPTDCRRWNDSFKDSKFLMYVR